MQRNGSEIIIEVEDVINDEEKEKKYKAELNVIWGQLSTIANNLIIMERIVNFPFHLFVAEDKLLFWSMTSKALFDSTILAFSTLLANGSNKHKGDENSVKSISLRRFKNKVFKYRRTDIDAEVWKEITKKIKDTDFTVAIDILNKNNNDGAARSIKSFEEAIEPLYNQIEEVRNQHIAHLDPKKVLSPEKLVPYRLSLKTLNEALEISDKLFQILGLGVWHQLPHWDYGDKNRKLDIDEILEFIAASSFWFVDDSLIDFKKEYEKLSDPDKIIFDEWRKKIGK